MSAYGMGITGGGQLSRDEVFDLLSSPRRRCIVAYLNRAGGSAELSTMAAQIAAWERETTVDELTPDDRKRVYTSLQQTHLEKLEESGVVEYDREQKQVFATETAEELEVYLEVIPGGAFPWREYYLALGAVGLAASLVVTFDVGFFAGVPETVVGIVIGLLVLFSALVQFRGSQNSAISLEPSSRD